MPHSHREEQLSSAGHRRAGPGRRDLRRGRGAIAARRCRRSRSSCSRASPRASAREASPTTRPPTIAVISIISLLAWAAWALLTFEIGGRLMPGAADARRRGRAAADNRLRVDARNAAGAGRHATRDEAGLHHHLHLDAAGDDRRRRASGPRLPQHPSSRGRLHVLGWVLAWRSQSGSDWCSGSSVS